MKRYLDYNIEILLKDFSMQYILEDVPEEEASEEEVSEEKVSEKEDYPNVIKYFRPENYELYEMLFERKDYFIKRKESSYLLSKTAYELDCFCKLLISFYACTGKKITPKKLHDKKIISNGRYTAWKGFFMESSLAEFFDVRRKKYKIKGVKELLDNPVTCALILHRYLKSWNGDNECVWIITDKVVRAYKESGKSCRLSEHEKNIITMGLVGRKIYKDETYLDPSRLIPSRKEDKRVKDFTQQEKNKLRQELDAIYGEMEIEEKLVIADRENVDERKVYLPEYLAPIMAAICEYHESNPFFISMNIWNKKARIQLWPKAGLDGENGDDLFKWYTGLMKYCDYIEEIENLSGKNKILEKYETFCYQLIYKIQRGSNKDNRIRYIQYFIAEQMLGIQLIEKETAIIYKFFTELGIGDIEKFIKEHRILGEILGRIYCLDGVFAKLEIAEKALNEYFNICKKTLHDVKISRDRDVREIIENKIRHENLIFRFRERIYMEDIFGNQEERPIGQLWDQFELEYKYEYLKYFERYSSLEDKIKEKKGMLRPKQLKYLAQEGLEDSEEKNRLKNWVIYNNILDGILPQFDFVDIN